MEIEQYQEQLQLLKYLGAGRHTQEHSTVGAQGVELDPGKMLMALGRRRVPVRVRRDLAAHDGAAPGQEGERGESNHLQLHWGN